MKPFAKKFGAPRLSAEEAARQGRATQLAFATFGNSEGAIAFLNTQDDALGGRPLDLAIASPEGLAAVEGALARRAPA